ncbi:general transcription factor 3C polypeptide 3 [Onthophagus taurus]|uniref:general transcription factor 3C polypeptide 3 n=1 Tax=Onthophagus taurus TaxID=166361 RepID=UPI000C20D44F|nr:general transcription factor 3C polypeptide 3 [Onthophagus taurus]
MENNQEIPSSSKISIKSEDSLRIESTKASPEITKNDSDSYDSDDYDFSQDIDSQNITENYENELDNDLLVEEEAPKAPRRQSKGRSKIPLHLKGLMGEANLRFARGDYETAKHMCYELIRQVPLAHEPYLTLANLCENEPQRSTQYLTIAAHLNPSDAQQWIRLAQIHISTGNLRKAVTCYTRAMLGSPNSANIDLQLKRLELLEKLNDTNYTRKCKIKLIHSYPPNQVDEILALAENVATSYHQDGDNQKAVDLVSVVFEKCPKGITLEMVNIYLQLLLLTKNYVKCLDIFVQYCNIEMEILIGENNKIAIESYSIPTTIHIDLKIKFIICLIHLESYQFVSNLINELLVEEDVDRIGDLYFDVAENLITMNQHGEALKLLVPLVKSKNFSLAAIWLKYGECQEVCKMPDQAIDSYYTVLRLVPQHHEVRFPLSDLLIAKNKLSDALDVLTQDYNSGEIHVKLLIKKINLLKEIGDFKAYFKSVKILLSRHCVEVKNATEIQSLFLESTSEKWTRIKRIRALGGDQSQIPEIKSVEDIPINDEYKLFKDCLKVCLDKKEYALLQKLSYLVLNSTKFKNNIKELLQIALYSCISNDDYLNGYTIARLIMLKNLNSNVHLNLLNLILQRLEEAKFSKFVMRQSKTLHKDYGKILEANNALCAGSYKIAIMILMPIFKQHLSPYITFLMGVNFLQLSQQKRRSKTKNFTPIVYSLFSHYANERSQDAFHEINYNLGRMYQKYGILHLAVYYYRLVLEFQHPLIEEHPDVLSLRREAAFNLFLIYKDCNNYVGARNLLIKYLTV